MTAHEKPLTWSQLCWVSLCVKGGSWVHFHSIIDTVDIDEGEGDVSDIPTVGGGRLIKVEPQAITTLTFEGYPIGIGVTTGDDIGFSQQFAGGTWDTSDPYSITKNRTPDKFKVAILWTDQTLTAGQGADVAISTDYNAYRWTATDAYITGVKKSFTDGVLKMTMTVKIPAYQKDGTATITEESCGNTTTLSAVAAYT